MRKVIWFSLVLLSMIMGACGEDGNGDVPLKGVMVGSQEWSAKNLDVDRFANGEAIPQAQTKQEWYAAAKNKQPAWCYYNEDPAHNTVYGKLYNWYAVADPRGLCPTGWHIPSDAEWTQMEDFVGGIAVTGKLMKSTALWEDNINGPGTDTYGWTGLPGGIRNETGQFDLLGRTGAWWTSTENPADYYLSPWDRYMYFNLDNAGRYYASKGVGCSVRCVKD